MMLGVVTKSSALKGYGFIAPTTDRTAASVFFHHSALRMDGLGCVSEGDTVRYVATRDDDGRSRAAVVVAVEPRAIGTVVQWRADKGFGFITPRAGGQNVFFHQSALRAVVDPLAVGETVEYAVGVDQVSGRCKATKVTVRRGAPHPPAVAFAAAPELLDDRLVVGVDGDDLLLAYMYGKKPFVSATLKITSGERRHALGGGDRAVRAHASPSQQLYQARRAQGDSARWDKSVVRRVAIAFGAPDRVVLVVGRSTGASAHVIAVLRAGGFAVCVVDDFGAAEFCSRPQGAANGGFCGGECVRTKRTPDGQLVEGHSTCQSCGCHYGRGHNGSRNVYHVACAIRDGRPRPAHLVR